MVIFFFVMRFLIIENEVNFFRGKIIKYIVNNEVN